MCAEKEEVAAEYRTRTVFASKALALGIHCGDPIARLKDSGVLRYSLSHLRHPPQGNNDNGQPNPWTLQSNSWMIISVVLGQGLDKGLQRIIQRADCHWQGSHSEGIGPRKGSVMLYSSPRNFARVQTGLYVCTPPPGFVLLAWYS